MIRSWVKDFWILHIYHNLLDISIIIYCIYFIYNISITMQQEVYRIFFHGSM